MVLMKAMLVLRKNRNCCHKNLVLFPKGGNFNVMTTNMAAMKTIYTFVLMKSVSLKNLFFFFCLATYIYMWSPNI